MSIMAISSSRNMFVHPYPMTRDSRADLSFFSSRFHQQTALSSKTIERFSAQTRCRSAATEEASSNGTGKFSKEKIIQLYQYLSSRGELIEKELERTISTLIAHSCPPELHRAIRYCTTAEEGRHLSSLCLSACELVGGDQHAALPMACSIELWMSIILTIDDLPCMDNAKTRRGRAAAHVEFDDTTALLATQALLGLAFETVVDSKLVSADKKLRLVKEFSIATQRLVFGQYDDMKKLRLQSLEELNAKNSNKTSSFFELPLVAGAIIGGGDEDDISSLRMFGRFFGLMYQVNDDLSDATMSAEEMGKDARIDTKNQKPTYLTMLGSVRSAQLRDELANSAKEALLQRFHPKKVEVLLGIVEATRRFGAIYKNSQLLAKT